MNTRNETGGTNTARFSFSRNSMPNHRNTVSKFWRFVDKHGPNGCWVWTGSLWASGYGRFQFNLKSDRAHRVSWIVSGRPIREEDCVLHKCDNRLCCNPEHLFLGTRADNNFDKVSKGRQSRGEIVRTARVTSKDVIAIRGSSETSYVLAQKYGLTWGHINKIRSGRAWTHV